MATIALRCAGRRDKGYGRLDNCNRVVGVVNQKSKMLELKCKACGFTAQFPIEEIVAMANGERDEDLEEVRENETV
jgi:transcription elongation factor Elf1